MPRFVPRQRKHKVLARQHAASNDPSPASSAPPSTNQDILIPQSKADREAKKLALREELRSQQNKVSSKKQKRLDKYIDTKLRKDETLDLLKKLENEKARYEATVAARGGALGKRSFEEFVGGGRGGGSQRVVKDRVAEDEVESEDEWEVENPEASGDEGAIELAIGKARASVAKGSGLAQPLVLDDNGLPIIQSRKPKKRKQVQEDVLEDTPWEGFESEKSDAESGSENDDLSDLGFDREDEEASISSGSEVSDDDDLITSEEDGTRSSTSDTSDENIRNQKIKPRNSVFKLWATQQLNQSMGHTPSYNAGEGQLLPAPIPAPKPETEIATPTISLVPSESRPNRKANAVHVARSDDIQQTRSQLPIIQHEQEIMEAIHNHPVVIIKGDTGSGKTTQIPQFLFEAGYGSPEGLTPGMIGITQPRRVAAVSMAKRVKTELGQFGSKVSHQIRFDSTVSSNTAIKFMTDGILLRELSQDLLLRKYSVIIIDEAHERSVNTDILVGMLSKIVPARIQKSKFNPDPKPLKLVIMSATLNLEDLMHEKLFAADMRPPIVVVEGRQHRVTTHFALKSRADYVDEVVEKVKRAHRKLPRGGILVFLTGKNEINQVQERLSTLLSPRNGTARPWKPPQMAVSASEVPLESEDFDMGVVKVDEEQDDFDLNIRTAEEDEAEEHEFEISDHEDGSVQETRSQISPAISANSKDLYTSVHILPFHSQLPTSEQEKIFDPPPPGARLIVLATNVAETSLTIPGIRYVFDTGRSKERKYDLNTGVQSFEVDYISKASSQQRAGRAGRTGPGHCWRLYTSAMYEQFFPEHAEPEILRTPAESVVLQLKGFRYPRPVSEFPFPTPPAAQTLTKAEQLLKNLGALTDSGSITELGSQFSLFPLPPRLGKILALAAAEQNRHLLHHVLNLVSALAVGDIFVTEAQLNPSHRSDAEDPHDQDASNALKQAHGRANATLTAHDKSSDAIKLLTASTLYKNATSATERETLCKTYFLRAKAMAEVAQLRNQLENLVRLNDPSTNTLDNSAKTADLKSSKVVTQLNTLAAAGYIDNLALRSDLHPSSQSTAQTRQKPRRAIDVPYLPFQPISSGTAVFIHPSSILARASVKSLPEYIVYSHLQRSQASTISATSSNDNVAPLPKTRMFPLTPLSASQIFGVARDTALLRFGKPLPRSKIEDVPGLPRRRECWVSCEVRASGNGSAGTLGWELPPVKVRQVMDTKSRDGWRVEEVLS